MLNDERQRVYRDIDAEREAQDRKWGGSEHDDEHTPRDWLVFISDHNRRALAAEINNDPEGYRRQLVRVAALAIAALESNDRLARKAGLEVDDG